MNVSEGADVSSADTTAAAAAAGKEGEKEEDTFSFKGQVIAAIVVTAVAGNILGARRFRCAPRPGLGGCQYVYIYGNGKGRVRWCVLAVCMYS